MKLNPVTFDSYLFLQMDFNKLQLKSTSQLLNHQQDLLFHIPQTD